MKIESDARCKEAQIRCSLIYQRISQQKLHKYRHAACCHASCVCCSLAAMVTTECGPSSRASIAMDVSRGREGARFAKKYSNPVYLPFSLRFAIAIGCNNFARIGAA